MFVVYTRAGCVACTATVKLLSKRNLPYQLRNADDHLDTIATITDERRLPVVISPTGEVFTGFRPDRLTIINTEGR